MGKVLITIAAAFDEETQTWRWLDEDSPGYRRVFAIDRSLIDTGSIVSAESVVQVQFDYWLKKD